jgi:hypothetical protein
MTMHDLNKSPVLDYTPSLHWQHGAMKTRGFSRIWLSYLCSRQTSQRRRLPTKMEGKKFDGLLRRSLTITLW